MGMEIELLRDATVHSITPKHERQSSLFLTRFEIARIVGERAKEISINALMPLLPTSTSTPDVGLSPQASSTDRGASSPPNQRWKRSLLDRSSIFTAAERETNPTARSVDPVMMAKYELVEKRIPMILKRTFPNGREECIPLHELEVDITFLDIRL